MGERRADRSRHGCTPFASAPRSSRGTDCRGAAPPDAGCAWHAAKRQDAPAAGTWTWTLPRWVTAVVRPAYLTATAESQTLPESCCALALSWTQLGRLGYCADRPSAQCRGRHLLFTQGSATCIASSNGSGSPVRRVGNRTTGKATSHDRSPWTVTSPRCRYPQRGMHAGTNFRCRYCSTQKKEEPAGSSCCRRETGSAAGRQESRRRAVARIGGKRTVGRALLRTRNRIGSGLHSNRVRRR